MLGRQKLRLRTSAIQLYGGAIVGLCSGQADANRVEVLLTVVRYLVAREPEDAQVFKADREPKVVS